MNVKLKALRMMGKRKLTGQFDEMCIRTITLAIEAALTRGHSNRGGVIAFLESAFTDKTKQRLVHAYMVIDCNASPMTPREPVELRGIINVQPVDSDGYSRYQFHLRRGAIDITVSHVRPRYV